MFSSYFLGMQQDMKIMLLPPVICALFRAIFIYVYTPPVRRCELMWKEKALACFRYGFWWGMDWNAYVYFLPLLAVTLPGAFFPAYYEIGDTVRIIGACAYCAVLYFAFMGKMIFYDHYRDTFNRTLLLGKHADKKNLADIFFNQHHGIWILLGVFPYLLICYEVLRLLLEIPRIAWPAFESETMEAVCFAAVFVLSIVFFYYFRYGGTLNHRNKPEWDEVPALVKNDAILAKAAVDDLVALEMVFKAVKPPCLTHTDEESLAILSAVLPKAFAGGDENPLQFFRRTAKGPRIEAPKHIFFVFAEGHAQAGFDSIYDNFHLMDGSKAFRHLPGTVSFDNFLAGGMISQPSISSILTGLYDVNLELNENTNFWRGTVPTAFARHLKKLGYRTEFWYGGSLTWGSLNHFAPATGFDRLWGGPDICPPGSPRTWLGIYDHIFLETAARMIQENKNDQPVFHFLYTTSNHGPYTMPLEEYGYDVGAMMPEYAAAIRANDSVWRRLGGAWYADQALSRFLTQMKEAFDDSLFIVTGDHSIYFLPFECGVMPCPEQTVRESVCTSFAISHPSLREDMFAGNIIGGHLNILPTIIELLAPKGFSYYSLFPSLLEPIDHVVTPYCWLNRHEIGVYDEQRVQPLGMATEVPRARRENPAYLEERDGWCELTGWMVRHPELLQSEISLKG